MRKSRFGDATCYEGKVRHGGLELSEASRFRALEDENAKLMRLLAGAMLDNAALEDLVRKNRSRPRHGGRPRCGWWSLGVLLEREGVRPNHDRLYRLCREEGLAVRRRRRRKRTTGTREPMPTPQA